MESLKEGHQRRMEKYRKQYEQRRKFYRLLKENASDILHSENFQKTRHHIQHGTMPVYRHCLDVAKQSIQINKALGLGCSERDLIRGALLHDYFLYDWHTQDYVSPHKLHGFYHPGRALKNAQQEYQLTPRERDIIKKHMWPLTISAMPMCREAWIVTMADKWCSLMETFHVHKGHGALIEKLRETREEQKK